MPTSKQRKGFKAKKIKNRKDLEKSRENKEAKMQRYMQNLIAQMKLEQQVKENVGIQDAVIIEDEVSENKAISAEINHVESTITKI